MMNDKKRNVSIKVDLNRSYTDFNHRQSDHDYNSNIYNDKSQTPKNTGKSKNKTGQLNAYDYVDK